MGANPRRLTLTVEGRDDKWVVINVLERNGLDWEAGRASGRVPEIDEAGGDTRLLDRLPTEIRVGTGRTVGFILDADVSLQSRWEAVRARLTEADVDCPENPPAGGFIGHSSRYLTRVGVWLMPDNRREGKVEDFLTTLISQEDPLIDHAHSATDAAKARGAQFTSPDRPKAVVHAWLAWQREPGYPYGKAIQAEFFERRSDVVDTFLLWFEDLYGVRFGPQATASE
jgi:hypothetical protein